MNDERKYSEEEIAGIFEKAAEAQEAAHSGLSHGEGLTLAELQHIGEEAGISPEFIARAAAATVKVGATPKSSGFFGFPFTVEHSVDLPGPLPDDEWDQLVADLRETFRASGKVSRNGSLREWRNGNLHAHIEPMASGHRLRLRTTKGNAGSSLAGGSILVAIGLVFLIIQSVTGDVAAAPDAMFVAMLALAGLSMIGLTRLTLPIWAKERSRQMEAVASRTVERMTRQPESAIREPSVSPQIELDAPPDVEEPGSERQRNRTRA